MHVHRLVSLAVGAAYIMLAGAGTRAAPATDPTAFIDTLVHDAMLTLSDQQLVGQARDQRLAQILEENFDLPRLAKFVLGRYWNTASVQEQQRFTAVFGQWVIKAYGKRLSKYSAEDITLTGTHSESDTSFVVRSRAIISSGAPPARLDWRVRKEGGDYKIVDVEFEGVSLASTQREEFASAIQRNGGTVPGLIQALESKIKSHDDTGEAAPLAQSGGDVR